MNLDLNTNILLKTFNAGSLTKIYMHIYTYKYFQRFNINNFNKAKAKWHSIHTYIFGTNTRNRARPRTFSKLWSA